MGEKVVFETMPVSDDNWVHRFFTEQPSIIGWDYGAAEGDWNTEIDGVRNADGSITITDMRRWKRTIET